MQPVRKKLVALSFAPIVITIDIELPNVQDVHLDHHQKAMKIRHTGMSHGIPNEIYVVLDA